MRPNANHLASGDSSASTSHPAPPQLDAFPRQLAGVPGQQLALLVLVALLGLFLVACAEKEEPPAPLSVVRIALHGDPSRLDPHLQSEVIAQSVLGNIYESLVAFDPDMRLVPRLAESWDNPSDLQWRFRLRQGIRFHDGQPLRIEDVLASIERVRRHPQSRQAGSLVAVISVRRLDDHTIELTTDRPYPILLSRLAFLSIVPADVPAEITRPIGTGPYRFESRQAGRIDLLAVPDHWRVRGAPTRAEYHFVADGTERSRGVRHGVFDLIDDVPLEMAEMIEDAQEVDLLPLSSLMVTYIQLDPKTPPFDDIRVRRAIHLGLDRSALARDLYGEFAVPVGQLVSRNVFGFAPQLQPAERQVERARQLLRDAGYGDGLGLEIELREGRPDAPLLAHQLKEIGIDLHITERPWGEMYPRLTQMRVPFYLGSWVNTSGDAGDVLDRKLHSRGLERGYGDTNYSDYSNPALDRVIEKSNSSLSLEERQRFLQEALALANEDLVYIPLYSRHKVYALRSELSWTPRQDGQVHAFAVAPNRGPVSKETSPRATGTP